MSGAEGPVPEAVLFVGLQASGKTSFYAERYLKTHVRISRDLLGTRHRERKLLAYCLETRVPFVVDDVNASAGERARFLEPLAGSGFRTVACCFASGLADCLARNARREGAERIPELGLRGTRARLVWPTATEGFDERRFVRARTDGGFDVEAFDDGLRPAR